MYVLCVVIEFERRPSHSKGINNAIKTRYFVCAAVRTDLARGFVTCELQLIETVPKALLERTQKFKSKHKPILDVRRFLLFQHTATSKYLLYN